MKLLKKIKNLNPNEKIIVKNTFWAFVVKGGALVVSLFTTPAFIRYFNNNTILGVWYTLLSVLIWFLNFDLGLGNGIRNNLVKAYAENDEDGIKKTISSGIFAVFTVAIALTVIGCFLLSLIDLNWLFNVDETLISYKTLFLATILVFASIMIRFFLTTITSLFYALQKSAINNFLSLCVSILQLLFVLIVHFDNPEKALVVLSVAYLVISNLPVVIAGIILFGTQLKKYIPRLKYIEKNYIKKVMGIGSVFFVCQILYMFIMNTNEFLVTKLFGPQYTTDYTFYYKLTSLISMVITLAMTPIWSVVTKAYVEKNYIWLNKLYKVIKFAGLGTIVLQFLLVPFLQFIMDIWLGSNSIEVNYLTAIAFACFGSVFVYSSMLSTVVCGMGRMKIQTICYGIGVAVKLLLVFVLSKYVNNWNLVVWSNVVILLPYCIIQQIDLDIYLKKLKNKKQQEEGEEYEHI